MSKPKPDAKSFDAFAAEHPATKKCLLCRIDPKLRDEMRQARTKPNGSYQRIAAWLTKFHDIKIGDSAVRAHFAKGHEDQR